MVAVADRVLRVVVEGQDKGAGKVLGQTEAKAHHFGAGLKTVGLVAGAVFAGIGVAAVRGIAKATVSFQAHQKVVAQTAAVLTSTGHASNQTVKGITRLSDALERKTTVDGDVIQSGANMIATFTGIRNQVGKGNDIFNQATATVLDMSVALGQDTKNSAIQLGKALNDPIKGVTALQRVGVTFNQGQKDQIKTLVDHGHKLAAQKIILAELNKEFGGSAAAAATPMGRLAVLGRQLGDVVGGAVLPAFNTLTSGLLTKLGPALSQIGDRDGPKVGKFLNNLAKTLVGVIPTSRELSLGVRALGEAFSGEGITTSSGTFVGKMERLGVTGRKVVDWAKGFGPLLGRIGESFTKLFQSSSQVGPALTQAGGGGHLFANSLIVVGPILDAVARNIHNLVPWLPTIVAGFLAFRAIRGVLGPVSDLGAAVRNFATPALVIATFAQARAQKALAAAVREQGASSLVAAGEQEASNAAGKVGLLTSIRARAAIIAQAVAQKVVAAATFVWATATRVLGLAMKGSLGPIGIIITLVAAVAGGLIYAYHHSETFRKIVDATWRGIRAATATAVTFILRLLQGWLSTWLTIAGGIVHGAAIAFGWIPGIGPKLKAADREFGQFRDSVNRTINKIIKKVDVDIRGHDKVGPVAARIRRELAAMTGVLPGQVLKSTVRGGTTRLAGGGGPLRGPGTTTSDSIPLWGSKGEFMVNAKATSRWLPVLQWINAKGHAAGGLIDEVAALPALRTRMLALGRRQLGAPGGTASVDKVARWTAAILGRPGEWAAWARRIMFESGGNWAAVNRVDSNWLAGHPSVGGAQVIRGTFAANAGRYRGVGPFLYGVSINPYANSYAGGHYAIGRYGSLAAVDPRVRPIGYDRGGSLPPGLSLAYNGTGRPEPVGGGGGIVVQVSGPFYVAGDARAFARELEPVMTQAIKEGLRRRGKGKTADLL